MLENRSYRLAWIPVAYLFIAAAVLVGLWWSGRPVALPDVAGGRVQCLSYTPPNALPTAQKLASLERIRADLQHLADYTKCVRTYSVGHGLDQVPQVARELGLEVMLGIWIGVDRKHNDREIARGIELARTYPDVIESVVVGNEVLLRREQGPDALRAYIQRVRQAIPLPVTYADVWEFWLEYPQVAKDVSFVTVHMLPYWENEPVPAGRAVAHIGRVLEQVERAFPQHRIVIGEAGWPSFGRQRAGAVPSRVNQARFFREFTAYAAEHDVQYNFIEAFDQPWKRALEGTVGGSWGLFDAHSRLKFPLQGAVQNNPAWRIPAAAGLLAAIAAAAAMALRGIRAWRAIAIGTLAAYSGGALIVLQWQYLFAANRNAQEWLGSLSWLISGWLVYACCSWLLVRAVLHGSVIQPLPSAARSFAAFGGRWRGDGGCTAVLSLARLPFMFGLAYIGLLLTLDSRYRDFPVVSAVLPAAALWLHSLVSGHNARSERPFEEVLLAYWLIVASVWIALAEGFDNLQALSWCALNLWVALTVMWSDWQARHHERAAEQTDRGELHPV